MARARALAVVIACAMASASAYSDYAGARMPHYHMDYDSHDAARDLYPERSPDASVSLDYKYEEDPPGKLERSTEKIVDDNESWLRTKKKRNRLLDVDHEYNQDIDKDSITEDRELNAKSSRVQLRNRPNFKRKKNDIEDEAFTQRDRRKYDDSNPSREMLQRLNGDRFRNFEKSSRNSGYGRVPVKARRKPRDRAEEPILDDSPSDGMLMAEKVFDTDDSAEEDLAQLAPHRRVASPSRSGGPPPDVDPTDSKANIKRPKQGYSDYSDEFYDMQRVLNLKNKLPLLMRRTKASSTTTERLEGWYRRANVPEREESDNEQQDNNNEQDELERDTIPLPVPTEKTYKTSRRPTTTETTTKAPTMRTTTKSPTTTRKKTTPKTSKPPASSSELSLAEKSRLSILKKAQRKENLKSGTVTTKPPVLMQVSQRMQTLVMVEPPGGEVQRMAARELSDDSPQRLAKAKRLIRHKLLSDAKSIRDLTDNWDDTVCEYIDVSLLSGAPAHTHTTALCVLILCLCALL